MQGAQVQSLVRELDPTCHSWDPGQSNELIKKKKKKEVPHPLSHKVACRYTSDVTLVASCRNVCFRAWSWDPRVNAYGIAHPPDGGAFDAEFALLPSAM